MNPFYKVVAYKVSFIACSDGLSLYMRYFTRVLVSLKQRSRLSGEFTIFIGSFYSSHSSLFPVALQLI